MRRESETLVRDRLEETTVPARPPSLDPGPEFDMDLFDETFDALGALVDLATAAAGDAEDGDSWQRLSAVIGRITGDPDLD